MKYKAFKLYQAVSSILTSDFKAGAGVGCLYGCGLYTTFAIESQFTNYMEFTYGKAVIKFKVTDLDKYLIFQLSVAKQIHGKDYKISDQLKKLGLLNKPNVNESNLKEYDELQEKEKHSSVLALKFYGQNDWIENSVKGIIYYGEHDGYCLLKYPTVQDGTITMWGYAVAEADNQQKMEELKSNIGWIKSVGVLGTPIKNVYKSPIKNKERFAIVDKSEIENVKSIFLNSKNLERTAKKLASELNKFTDKNVAELLQDATDKNKMAEVIAKYKTELTDWNVSNLLDAATKKDEIAELIVKYKKELTDMNVSGLLDAATDKDKFEEIIANKKPELSYDDIWNFFYHSTNKEKTAELIQKQTDNISRLSNKNVEILLRDSKDKPKLAQILNKYHKNKTSEIQEILDKYLESQAIAAKKTPKIQEFIDKYSSIYKLNLGKKIVSNGSFT